MAGKTTAEELERLWTWTGDIIEELEELRATIARLYDDEETPRGVRCENDIGG
ncbi:MAG: hypothetical protein J5I35_09745 [Methanothrix harundinacea]|nr:hypothetical protein [Methanothrix harundinacea]